MIPLLAIAGARIGANILQNVAENVVTKKTAEPASAAQQAQFSELLARAAASRPVQEARFLRSEGIQDRADAEARLNEIAQQIAQAPEIREATAGSTAAFDLRVKSDGEIEVRTADGRIRTVALSEEGKALAAKVRRILEAMGSAPQTNSTHGVLHITPGGGVSVRR
jgi:hypothetical protein